MFALPSLGVNILQALNHSVNSVWIGRFLGEEALAASANAGLIMFLMFSTLFGFTMATTILIGQSMGRRDVESVRRIMGTAFGMEQWLGERDHGGTPAGSPPVRRSWLPRWLQAHSPR